MPHKSNVVMKPFCYYCGREFIDEKSLIRHQQRVHFTCPQCQRVFVGAPTLARHMNSHNVQNFTVPNAQPGRESPADYVVGMEGVPFAALQEQEAAVKARLKPGQKLVITREFYATTIRVGSHRTYRPQTQNRPPQQQNRPPQNRPMQNRQPTASNPPKTSLW